MQMEGFTNKKGYIGLSSTQVTMLDSIIDPFGTATDELSFLNVEAFFDADFDDANDNGNLYFILELHGKTMIQQRVRYGVW